MRESAERIEEEGVSIIAVVPADGEQIRAFSNAFGSYPFPILGDPGRVAYQKMGHKRMSRWTLVPIAFRLLTGQIKLFKDDPKQNEVVKKAIRTQDTMQNGGAWLFSESGDLLWSHIDDQPQNHATIEEILKQIRA